MTSRYYVKNNLVVGKAYYVDNHQGKGWKWFPYNSAQRLSKRLWATPEDAIRGRNSGGIFITATSADEAMTIASADRVEPHPHRPISEHVGLCSICGGTATAPQHGAVTEPLTDEDVKGMAEFLDKAELTDKKSLAKLAVDLQVVLKQADGIHASLKKLEGMTDTPMNLSLAADALSRAQENYDTALANTRLEGLAQNVWNQMSEHIPQVRRNKVRSLLVTSLIHAFKKGMNHKPL